MTDAWDAQMKALGGFIRSQRKLANLSLRQLADLTSLSNPYLSQIERGLHQPSVRVLRLLADALNVSGETLLAEAGLLEHGDGRRSRRGGQRPGLGGVGDPGRRPARRRPEGRAARGVPEHAQRPVAPRPAWIPVPAGPHIPRIARYGHAPAQDPVPWDQRPWPLRPHRATLGA